MGKRRHADATGRQDGSAAQQRTGNDLIRIYLYPAQSAVGGSDRDILQYAVRLTPTQPTPTQKLVVAPRSGGGKYPALMGPVLDFTGGDVPDGRLDPARYRTVGCDPSPDYCCWHYWESEIPTVCRATLTLNCLQAFGEWWVVEGEPIVGAAQKVAALDLRRKPAGTVHRLRVAGGPSNLSHLEDRMKLPLRRNKPKPVYASGATVVATLPDKHPHIVPFDGDLEDTLTLKRHAVRALCALLMDRHDACLSEHQFCGLYTHYRLGDTPARLVAHPIPQATASGQELLAIYLCQATGGASGDGLNRLEYTARLVCADRVPHRKVVAQPSSDGGYAMSIGPLLNTIEDDHYTGGSTGATRGRPSATPSRPTPGGSTTTRR